MRLLTCLMGSLCLIVSCNSPSSQPPATNAIPVEQANACNCQVTFLNQRGTDYWFSVKDFDAKNHECFQYLRKYAHSFALKRFGTQTLHFFDNLPDFTPPADGHSNYGGEKVMNQEILLFRRIGDYDEFYTFDNWETGKYKEI